MISIVKTKDTFFTVVKFFSEYQKKNFKLTFSFFFLKLLVHNLFLHKI